jgi:flagellar hook assembly protein FlgD
MCTSPFVPGYNMGVCDKPTMLYSTFSDTTSGNSNGVCILEIYDYQKRLVKTGIFGLPSPDSISKFSLYWNGMDQFGNEVSSGKYTVKTSMLRPKDTTCSCQEVFVGK